MKKKILFLFCFVIILLNSSHIQAVNLLTNASFETWSSGPTGWTVSSAPSVSQNTNIYNDGTKSCRVTASSGSDVTISQQVAITPGKTYTVRISYYMESVSGTGKDLSISSYFQTATNSPIKLNLEDSLALKGPGGVGSYFTSSIGSWKTYTYDVIAPANASYFNLSVIVSKNATISLDNFYFAENSTPTIYTNQTSLSGFSYSTSAGGPSSEQSFSIKGYNLSSNITITAPTNYQISISSGSSFVGVNSLSITRNGKTVNTQTIYIRLNAGLSANTYTGNVTLSSTGASSITIPVSGSVTSQPVTITPSVTSLTDFSYISGSGPSAEKSFTVSGTGLTASGILVTAPSNYEISVFSGASFSGSPSFTLAQSGGNVSTTTIYVRLKSGLQVGSYNGNIILTNGSTWANISLSGSVLINSGITLSTTALSGFNYMFASGPSAEKTFSVTGSSLTSSFIMVVPPTGYEMSTETGSGFNPTSLVIIPCTDGTVPSTNIYFRLKSGLTIGNYNGNVSVISSGYSTQTVALSGSVTLNTAIDDVAENSLKAYGNGSEIIVEGTATNELISVYNLVGMQLKSVRSTGDRLSIPVSQGGVYLVRTSKKTLKVIL